MQRDERRIIHNDVAHIVFLFFYDQNVEMELETIERKNEPESEKEEQATKHGRWERKGNHRM